MRPPSTRTNLLRFYTVDDLRTVPPARWLIVGSRREEMELVMKRKIQAHDGVVGATYMLSVILGSVVSPQWLWIAGVVAGLQIISPITRFCPVYFVLNKMMPDTEPIQDGSRT